MSYYDKYLKYKIKYLAMHDTLNNMIGGTNISTMLDKLPQNSTVSVGYYVGSFSPIHNGHIDIMDKFKSKLIEIGISSNNILGIVSLNDDSHMTKKGIFKDDFIDINLRTKLVTHAFNTHDWIQVVNIKAYPQYLLNDIESPLYKYKDKIRFIFYEISGSDDTLKGRKWESSKRSHTNRLFTCFRKGDINHKTIQDRLDEVTIKIGFPINTINARYITSYSDTNISSSAIRKAVNTINKQLLIDSLPTTVLTTLQSEGPWKDKLTILFNKESIVTLDMNTSSNRIVVLNENKKLYGEMETGILQNEVRPTAMITSIASIPSQLGKSGDNNDTIFFMDSTTNNAIIFYNERNYNVTALNFANANWVCGGVEQGSLAQEEELCRTSMMLYNSLQQHTSGIKEVSKPNTNMLRYKYTDWGSDKWHSNLLYTPNIVFRRMDSKNLYSFTNIYTSSIITSAAPDWRHWWFNKDDFSTITLTKKHQSISKIEITSKIIKVIETIYRSPTLAYDDILYNRNKIKWSNPKPSITSIKELMDSDKKNVLILGAWGCGAFIPDKNPGKYREFMAEQFSYVLKNIKKKYDVICFAIMKDNTNNYNIFKEVMEKSFTIKEIT